MNKIIRSTKVQPPQLSPIATAVKLSIVGLGLAHGASQAATIQVTSNLDDGTGCSLREAIVSINNATLPLEDGCSSTGATLGTDDSITFSNSLANNIIQMEEFGAGRLSIAPGRTVTIDATMVAEGITVDANQDSGVFYANRATLTVNNMTITGGAANTGGGISATASANVTLNNSTVAGNSAVFRGGGIYANNSEITLNNSTVAGNSGSFDGGGVLARDSSSVSLSYSTVSANSASRGGGIFARDSSSVSLSNSTVSGNSANRFGSNGGGIAVSDSSSVSLSNSTVSGNSATGDGGGIAARYSSSVSLSNSTVSGNSAIFIGGGVFAYNTSSVSLSNSTVSGNYSTLYGGGIFARNACSVSLSNSTVSSNSTNRYGGGIAARYSSSVSLSNSTVFRNVAQREGGGIFVDSRTYATLLANNVVAGNIGGDCRILISDGVSNFFGDDSCTGSVTGDGNPRLGSLQNNGGPTRTHAPAPNSPLIGAGDIDACRAAPINGLDQRSEPRNADGNDTCFIGAVEGVVEEDSGFSVIPLGNDKVAVIPL